LHGPFEQRDERIVHGRRARDDVRMARIGLRQLA
jgi:hypothetical protein